MTSEISSSVCPSCGAKVRMDAFGERAVCEYCGSELFVNPEKRHVLRPQIAQPAQVSITKDSQSARLVQRWFSFKFIPLAFFALAWDSFLVFWYGMAFASGAPWIMIVFPVAHLAIGVGITYYTIAGFINRTILEISGETISVWFEPLPWIGKKNLKTAELKQLFCKEKIVRNKNGSSTQYELYAVTAANMQVKLLGGLDNSDTALFLEQQLERWLNIEDRPVAGEIPR
jgi:DNA-directed RNA polymerase subunit RPC12/RpoP